MDVPEHAHGPEHAVPAVSPELRLDAPEVGDLAGPGPVAVSGLAVKRSAGADESDPLGGTPVQADVVSALRRRQGRGAALPTEVADRIGEHLGTNLGGVRVHADGESDRIARSMQATAFTHGSDIYFTQGTYSPSTGSGQRLLAHELAHVAQDRARPSAAGAGAPVIGRADDPAERAADRAAEGAVSALRRRSSAVSRLAAASTPATEIRRWFGSKWFNKKKKVAEVTAKATGPTTAPTTGAATPAVGAAPAVEVAPPEKTAKDEFTESINGKAPKNPAEARTRMADLRTMLTAMTPAERSSISTDAALMEKARTFVGSFEYMSLVTAVGMAANTPAKPGAKAADKPNHLSGAQADTFIQAEMGKIAHLKGYLDTAVGAGKKADGFVATVNADDWKKIYEQQNKGKTAGTDDLATNAFIANKHPDRPAIIHEDRGTPSTAIHESMHRYSELKVLHKYGSPLNEGMTEYFTRLITDVDGKPLNGKASNRANYQANWSFICTMLDLLGANTTAAQTALAEIYFSGKVDVIKTSFTEKCAEAKLGKVKTDELWTAFAKAIGDGTWADAKASMPPKKAAEAPAVTPPVAPVAAKTATK